MDKIKRIGADAVKLLAQFEPTEPESAEHQFALIQQVYEECQKHDILLLLETIAFPFGGEKKDSKSFLDRKAETVIESARQLSRYCDVYKAEFPGWLGKDSEGKLIDNLRQLDAASERPWVLLSAGVDFPAYKQQVEMAMDAGASGVLGGRAFWKEYFLQDGPAAREQFARGEAADRVRQIDEIVKAKAKPWFARYGLTMEELHGVRAAEGWHFRYGGEFDADARHGSGRRILTNDDRRDFFWLGALCRIAPNQKKSRHFFLSPSWISDTMGTSTLFHFREGV